MADDVSATDLELSHQSETACYLVTDVGGRFGCVPLPKPGHR
jgi:hypothetical protein